MSSDHWLSTPLPNKRHKTLKNLNYSQDYASKGISPKAKYKLIIDDGQSFPSFEGYMSAIGFYNRAVNRFRKHYKLKTSHFSLLILIYRLTIVRQRNEVALKTVITNYLCVSGKYNLPIALIHDLQKNYLVSFSYVGHVTGSKIFVTILGEHLVKQIYQEFQDVMGIYPQNK